MTMTTDPNITPGTTALNTHLNNLITAINGSTSNVFLAYANKSGLPSAASKGDLIEKIDFTGITATLDSMEGVCSNCATYVTYSDASGTTCATNSTYENACTTNSTYENSCATNSTYSEQQSGNSTYSEECSTNSTYSEEYTYSTWSDNLDYATWSESLDYGTEITGTEYVTENADMSIASGAYSYSCTNYCATNTTFDTWSEVQDNSTWAESLSYDTWAESLSYSTWAESLTYSTWAESLTYSTNAESLTYSTNSESLTYSTFNHSSGTCNTNSTFTVSP